MPLPEGGRVPFPSKEWDAFYRLYQEHSAWYAGDPDLLADVYGGAVTLRGRPPWWKFWARAGQEKLEHQTRSQLHAPLASDIAATSAALLFSEAPSFVIPDAHVEQANPDAKAAQERLDQIISVGGIVDRLSEAGETAAALGGVFLKPDWDRSVADVPLLVVVQADNAIPEFTHGMLRAVTLWRAVLGIERGENRVYRHLERHEVDPETGRGIVAHGLYRGSREQLGDRVPLTDSDETAELEEFIALPFDGLGIRYVANIRPNRRFRGSALGQSDYSGAEGMLDALDETWTSWIRDLRLAKARILVPEEYLERNSGGGVGFDLEQEIFTPLEMDPSSSQITSTQFAIRVDEHERTMIALLEQIVGHAGYSPQTFGMHIEGRAESGTALRVRERKTLTTQQRKRRYWEPAIADVLYMLLAIDREIFRNRTPLFRPRVNLADSIADDPIEIASTVEMLNRAQAISIEQKVAMAHPDWKQAEIDAETARIKQEQGLAVPDAMQIGIA